jgi:hypothetical protein
MCHINEFRRIGLVQVPPIESLVRTWVSKHPAEMTDLGALLACCQVSVPAADGAHAPAWAAGAFYIGVSAVHPVARLSREFAGLPNGHERSHQFLVDDFVLACIWGTLAQANVWMAARRCMPGIVAHESAQRHGESPAIPDFEAPPLA